MSKVMLNHNYIGDATPSEGEDYTIQQEQLMYFLEPEDASFARVLINELHKNSAFMSSVAAWETLTFDPSNLAKDAMKAEDYYTAILFCVLDSKVNDSEFLDALNCNTNQTIIKLSSSVSSLVEAQLNEDNLNLKNIDLSNQSLKSFSHTSLFQLNNIIDRYSSVNIGSSGLTVYILKLF